MGRRPHTTLSLEKLWVIIVHRSLQSTFDAMTLCVEYAIEKKRPCIASKLWKFLIVLRGDGEIRFVSILARVEAVFPRSRSISRIRNLHAMLGDVHMMQIHAPRSRSCRPSIACEWLFISFLLPFILFLLLSSNQRYFFGGGCPARDVKFIFFPILAKEDSD